MMLGSQQAQPLLASSFFGSFEGSTICNTCSSIYVTFRKISRERRRKKKKRKRKSHLCGSWCDCGLRVD
jgi:hypothetical protein